ncbi:WD40-repeat-containing domain protein [Radiomyces spectabilis]|uniref:WD40-repeat-containing domain protein n=1 Tax=Radiomyces spectabilis TaxID=64574 RepID=UPI00221EE5F7|nr:WD40-repeat-containing domain protein [Radiomyces spectabilis]KAI8387987.1 WD40-repeat-containing domain protein [Radiomyces spectabilis]
MLTTLTTLKRKHDDQNNGGGKLDIATQEAAPLIAPIDNKILKRFHHRTDPTLWNQYHALQQRSLYGQRIFGRKINFSARSLLPLYQCPTNQIYRFYLDNDKDCFPFYCSYAHNAYGGKLLTVGDENGRISFLRTDKTNSSQDSIYHDIFKAHTTAILDVKWSTDDTTLATASGDRNICLWDVESKVCLAVLKGHKSSLNSINWHPTNQNLLVSASKDGSFRIWDTRYRQIDRDDSNDRLPIYDSIKTVSDAHGDQIMQKKRVSKSVARPKYLDRSVTCALFMNNSEEKIITSGCYDGAIKLWDCRAGRNPSAIARTVFAGKSGRPRGVIDIKMDNSGTRLFSLCMDHSIYMHYLTDLSRPAQQYTDPDYNANSFFIKLAVSPDDRFIMAGSTVKSVFAWEVDRPKAPAVQFAGHSAVVTSVSWCHTDINQFASCSDDLSTRIWNVDFDKQTDMETSNDSVT